MKRVAIATLGCKTNQFESAAMTEQFSSAGYAVVPFTEPADIYVINSCTVTARTDAETRRLIRRARRMNPEARIVATGCYAQVAPGELERMPEVDAVLGNREKKAIAAFVADGRSEVSDVGGEAELEPLRLESFSEHTRAFLQVQNGCNSFCTYCIVPYARGRSRSASMDAVLAGIDTLARNGHKEVVLTGIHLGAYGLDLVPQTSLLELVRQIIGRRLIPRLRLGSIEPNELEPDLLELIASSEYICRHLHLPMQSGSDTILARMGRRYDAGLFEDLVRRIATRMPDAFIGADVIAGFPGETDEEFRQTLSLLERLPLAGLHVFPYSRRPGTRAAEFPVQVQPGAIKRRAEQLRQLAERKKHQFLEGMIGKELQVLVQGYRGDSAVASGLSRNYVTVTFAGIGDQTNEEVTVAVTGVDREKGSLIGEVRK